MIKVHYDVCYNISSQGRSRAIMTRTAFVDTLDQLHTLVDQMIVYRNRFTYISVISAIGHCDKADSRVWYRNNGYQDNLDTVRLLGSVMVQSVI